MNIRYCFSETGVYNCRVEAYSILGNVKIKQDATDMKRPKLGKSKSRDMSVHSMSSLPLPSKSPAMNSIQSSSVSISSQSESVVADYWLVVMVTGSSNKQHVVSYNKFESVSDNSETEHLSGYNPAFFYMFIGMAAIGCLAVVFRNKAKERSILISRHPNYSTIQ